MDKNSKLINKSIKTYLWYRWHQRQGRTSVTNSPLPWHEKISIFFLLLFTFLLSFLQEWCKIYSWLFKLLICSYCSLTLWQDLLKPTQIIEHILNFRLLTSYYFSLALCENLFKLAYLIEYIVNFKSKK